MNNKDWEAENSQQQAEHQGILAEERRKLYRQREHVEALEKQMTDFIADALRDERNKQSLGQEGVQTMKDSQRGIDPIKEVLKGGNAQRFGEVREGEITGWEDKPWLKD